eukprot:CAMPEP_0204531300 /NCGR_PEP_ID=MMETSP0661-20131031/11094_1 /ASSEMBLY_ACC=CAM_ASM_000606 /TAXON_ID=109239 /ORGANISM="Alexandrium margalefi, Strain AMGDE01CS-322" /LENGTH=160 /DNA_ID=CAMNT_0051537449 /DNA_START=70 /DNA_END=552 /DNA_ORIENTATION=-
MPAGSPGPSMPAGLPGLSMWYFLVNCFADASVAKYARPLRCLHSGYCVYCLHLALFGHLLYSNLLDFCGDTDSYLLCFNLLDDPCLVDAPVAKYALPSRYWHSGDCSHGFSHAFGGDTDSYLLCLNLLDDVLISFSDQFSDKYPSYFDGLTSEAPPAAPA